MQNLKTIIQDFSTLLLQFLENTYILCPNTILSNNKNFVNNFISDNPEIIIKFFTKNFIQYKKELNDNPTLFLSTHNFSSDIEHIDELKGFNFSQIFIFQQIWNNLNDHNKNIIIDYMQYLFQLAEMYLNLL